MRVIYKCIDTDNVFEKVFENFKHFKIEYKYKYFLFLKARYKYLGKNI